MSTGFTCPRCSATSYHPADVSEGYCGACHAWTRDDVLAAARDLLAQRIPKTSTFPMSGVDRLAAAVRAADEANEAQP